MIVAQNWATAKQIILADSPQKELSDHILTFQIRFFEFEKKERDDARRRPDKFVEGRPPLLYTHTACGNLVKSLNHIFPGKSTVCKILQNVFIVPEQIECISICGRYFIFYVHICQW